MQEIKEIIDKKYIEFFKSERLIKVTKKWFYDFCDILIKQGYSLKEIENIINDMMSEQSLENMSKPGMVQNFSSVQEYLENEKAFFEYLKEKLEESNPEYLEKGLKYAKQETNNAGNFIDAFIKYIVITNFEELSLKSTIPEMSKENSTGTMKCCLGNFKLSKVDCEMEEDKIYFDELHTRRNLTGTKIGTILFRGLMKEIHDHFPNKDLYANRVRKVNEGAIRFYKRMGGEIFDYGNETQYGVIYRKEKMEELSKEPIIPPTLELTERERFIKNLQTQVSNTKQSEFPTDEEILKNMDINDKFYSFDIKDIDRRIRISNLTKNGEQLYLYRKSIENKKLFGGNCVLRTQYYIVNSSGEIVGRIPIGIGNPHSLSMDYWLKEDYQGKGIGTIALEEVIKQIYDKKEFDKLHFSSVKYPDVEETKIKSIGLEISDDNEPSKRIATKNGFKKVGERSFSLTLEDYIKQREKTIRD